MESTLSTLLSTIGVKADLCIDQRAKSTYDISTATKLKNHLKGSFIQHYHDI